MPARWRATWEGRLRTFLADGKPHPANPAVWRHIREFVKRLRRAGVTVIPSTDAAGWNPYASPGASLHRELAILRECGYSNRELLTMATSGAAKALRREWEFGTVSPGQRADLLLLRGNPLRDLGHLREIDAVFLRGTPHAPANLRP